MEFVRVSFVCVSVSLMLVVSTSAQVTFRPPSTTMRGFSMTTIWSSCCKGSSNMGGMNTWQLVAIIVPCVIGGVTLLSILIYCCCCHVGAESGVVLQQPVVAMPYPAPQCGCGAYSGTKNCSRCQGSQGLQRSINITGPILMAPRYASRSHVMPAPIYNRY